MPEDDWKNYPFLPLKPWLTPKPRGMPQKGLKRPYRPIPAHRSTIIWSARASSGSSHTRSRWSATPIS